MAHPMASSSSNSSFVPSAGADSTQKLRRLACPFTCIQEKKFSVLRTWAEKAGKEKIDLRHPVHGFTPLLAAARLGREGMVEYLVNECGATLDVFDNFGVTPLCAAAANGHLSIVKFLLPLHLRLEPKKESEKKKVLNAPAMKQYFFPPSSFVNGRPQDPALWVAAVKNHFSVVRYLIEEGGADVNFCDKTGDTPLLLAAYKNNQEVLKYLVLEAHADTRQRCRKGKSAADWARERRHPEMLKFLVDFEQKQILHILQRDSSQLGDAPQSGTGSFGLKEQRNNMFKKKFE
eukprot:CAMPEP_0184488744 /NCGR_PEP_ID=MMETSP0113_2-20130426/13157_1 /TAXON_ID=91329 /ORGANISM="Norrisiella sphaerica, Strain BC52" /LENGTH=289 /DNA_ID=CAMNT_0026871719 /DNA_START=249 /DNA_END=1117 /DNA_ORIENTATION=+